MDLESQLFDSYQEEKQKRYLELIGHTDEYLYVSFPEWSPELFKCVEKQGIEKEKWNCPTYGEVSLNYITSEYITNNDKPYFIREGSTCAICFEPLTTSKKSYITECNHHFCKSCITAHYNATYLNNTFSCPLCRHKLQKCLWLERRYVLEPWRLQKKKKLNTNVDFEFQRELFNEDILVCKGCNCTPGCHLLVGSNSSCEACNAWRYFTLDDMPHKCMCHKPEKKRTCCSWSNTLRSVGDTLSFVMGFRRSLVVPS